ncbi:ankyrin repeat domain-containing protein [Phytobacter sp. V91]|uniref:ankyrin repeat domain-containing protein n=1 Tax=Phytobacter sp. V91 TaxID=3369425 RepID=UPI003F60A23A
MYFLVDVAKTDVNGVTGDYQETPLMIAAYYGTIKHQQIAGFLIRHGANVNATSPVYINSALITAIWKNNVEFARFLLKNGADPSVSGFGRKESYACKYAIRKGRPKIIPYIPDCCSLVEKNSRWIRDVGYYCP